MLRYLTLIFVCQLVGELFVGAFGLPIPGPVAGLLALLLFLVIRGHVPAELAEVTDGLQRHMQLLYVPAATGVMVYLGLLASHLVAFSLSILVSTIVGIGVTGVVLQLLLKGRRDG